MRGFAYFLALLVAYAGLAVTTAPRVAVAEPERRVTPDQLRLVPMLGLAPGEELRLARLADDEKKKADPPKKFPRGSKPTPKHKLASAPRFVAPRAVPTQFAWVPSKLSMWLNDQFGDCVTAEEAFKCACSGIFIQDATVKVWASKNNVLDGADLSQVLDAMLTSGFQQDGNSYNDGSKALVDYSNEALLQAAIAQGPVKLGMDASALPSGAGNVQGWTAFGGRPGQFSNEDHSTSLCGFGSAKYLFAQLQVPLPQGVDPNKPCYLHYTWATIGVVDHDWIMSTVGEAWVRSPNTVTVGTGIPIPDPPLNPPSPVPPGPGPVPPPGPGPIPPGPNTITIDGTTTIAALVAAYDSAQGRVIASPNMTLADLMTALNVGQGGVMLRKDMTLEELIKAMEKVKAPTRAVTAPDPRDAINQRLDDLTRAMDALLKRELDKAEKEKAAKPLPKE